MQEQDRIVRMGEVFELEDIRDGEVFLCMFAKISNGEGRPERTPVGAVIHLNSGNFLDGREFLMPEGRAVIFNSDGSYGRDTIGKYRLKSRSRMVGREQY